MEFPSPQQWGKSLPGHQPDPPSSTRKTAIQPSAGESCAIALRQVPENPITMPTGPALLWHRFRKGRSVSWEPQAQFSSKQARLGQACPSGPPFSTMWSEGQLPPSWYSLIPISHQLQRWGERSHSVGWSNRKGQLRANYSWIWLLTDPLSTFLKSCKSLSRKAWTHWERGAYALQGVGKDLRSNM